MTVDGEKDDAETQHGPIQTTTFQIIDETEELPAHNTKSLDRRWRAAVNLFHRRCFTNDPLKVARWRDLKVIELPAMRLPSFFSPHQIMRPEFQMDNW